MRRKRRQAYTRVVKPGGEKDTKTFSPSGELKKLVDTYLGEVQKAVDSGKDANTAFKTKPDLDDLTTEDLLELLFHNKKLGEAPIKELNYLDLFSILQNLLEQKVWQLAVQWWGQQETKLKKQKQRDETETVVLPKAAGFRRFARLNPLDISVLDIDFASGQEPEDNEDFGTLITISFSVSDQSLASLVGKQRRVLYRYLEKASKQQLLNIVLNNNKILRFLKPTIRRFLNEYFVYDLNIDAPQYFNFDWAEESDYPYSVKVNPADESVTFEVEIDVWD